MNIVFVCTGNICRSPMAEIYFKHLCKERGLKVEISSAGTFAGLGEPASINSVKAVSEYSLDLSDFASSPLTADRLKAADMVICMTASHRFQIGAISPDALAKTFLLGDFAEDGHDIADPYGAPLPVYQACFAQMRPLLEKLLNVVAAKINS